MADGTWIVNQVDLGRGRQSGPALRSSATGHRRHPQPLIIGGNFAPPAAVILLGELEQDAGGRLRMHEGDPAPAGPGAGSLVDQAVAGRAAGRQRGVEIGHPVADVVDPGTATLEELGNGTVRA